MPGRCLTMVENSSLIAIAATVLHILAFCCDGKQLIELNRPNLSLGQIVGDLGTGLALSMIHDIVVEQHGGRIEVENKLGESPSSLLPCHATIGRVMRQNDRLWPKTAVRCAVECPALRE